MGAAFSIFVLAATALAALGLQVTEMANGLLAFSVEGQTLMTNALFTGSSDDTMFAVPMGRQQHKRASKVATVQWTAESEAVVRVDMTADPLTALSGAAFSFAKTDTFYGVWEYPFHYSITNMNLDQEVDGLNGSQVGINYDNARAPFFFTKSGFGVYVDTTVMGRFHFSGNAANFTFDGTGISYRVFYSKDPKGILMTYANLTAKPLLPPDSGYGPIFWSDDITTDFHGAVNDSQQNFGDIVDHLYYNRIRATALFADRPYGTGAEGWGNFDFAPRFFPDPAALVANLSAWGLDFQVWAANRAFQDTLLYGNASANGWLFPGIDPKFPGPALNLSIPAAYDYFLQALSYFPDIGVKGYKIDRGEEGEMPDVQQNLMSSLFDALLYQSMEAKWGAGNFYNFARSAFDRARAHTAVWNGDSHADFEGLRYSVASAVRAGLILFSQWGSDTGGYVRGAGEPSEELWARWMQFSAFSPMYEVMVGTGRTPWYAPYTARLVGVLRDTSGWHARLLPYIRSYAYAASTTGVPVVRALFLEFPGDEGVYDTPDQYMFGEGLLVAPFVDAGGNRTVYFPEGAAFLEYFNKTGVHHGGTNASVSLELEYLPVYVREGAVVPVGDVYQGNAKWIQNYTAWVDVEVFPSFAVPATTFEFLRLDGRPALITVATNATAGTVSVRSEDLGVDGALRVYGAGGVTNFTRPPGGTSMSITLNDFVSLFGNGTAYS